MFVVTVTFRIRPGKIEDFMPLMMAQARNSLTLESGCRVFDVCQSEQTPEEVFLYEVYDDRAAFDMHLASDHFASFDSAVADLVAEKTVNLYVKN